MVRLVFVFSVLLAGLWCAEANRPVFCYYASWSHWRPENGAFNVTNINAHLCTHLLYAFFGIDEEGKVQILDPWLDLEDDFGIGNIRLFNELRLANPSLKTLAAIGGAHIESFLFSALAANPSARAAFAQNARSFCQEHGFDGVDIDWEFPGHHDGVDSSNDKTNFALMLQELATELHNYGLLLTAAVAASEPIASTAYDIPAIVPHLDFISLMTYDFNGAWNDVTGHNAPLHAGPSDQNDFQRMLNVEHSVNYWLRQGAPANKLLLGVPTYGRSLTLADREENGLRAPSVGPGPQGVYTREPGYIAYFEICFNFQPYSKWVRVWEVTQKVPYAFYNDQWIGYDDRESITEKCKFVIERGLAGAMVWTIDMDDFRGDCGPQFQLIQTLNVCLNR
ncbi:chitinase-3-like protein 1 [Anopheles aquasalis]|uniref:chitinase-3-like protein 1 n=1 Tax=Anopheles aquasalis TaxID=42839 RepID=UPI00215A13C1|nr:chitinase-3-like protein 1 [Anopheles aquasalis]